MIKHEVYLINNDEMMLKITETSKERIITTQMNLNLQGLIKTEGYYEFYDMSYQYP